MGCRIAFCLKILNSPGMGIRGGESSICNGCYVLVDLPEGEEDEVDITRRLEWLRF